LSVFLFFALTAIVPSVCVVATFSGIFHIILLDMSGLGDNAITSISCAAYRENCPSNTVPVRIERLCLVKKTFVLALIIKNSLDED